MLLKEATFAKDFADTEFLKNSFRIAYRNWSQFGLLLDLDWDLMHENKSSIWSCDNLYVKKYFMGLSGIVNSFVARQITLFMLTMNPSTKVFLGCCNTFVPSIFRLLKYSNECQYSLLDSFNGALYPLLTGHLLFNRSNALSTIRMNCTVASQSLKFAL